MKCRHNRKARWFAIFAATAAMLSLEACATLESTSLREEPGVLPVRAEVPKVPFFPQSRLFCGPAALATVLVWSGIPVTQESVAHEVFTPGRAGTLAPDMIVAARRHGRLAVPIRDLRDMLGEIAAGHPVIVFQNLGLEAIPVWHYSVAYGFDLRVGTIALRSGEHAHLATPLDVFERTWRRADRWAVVVLPPDRIPATAKEADVVRAAAGLERTGRMHEAALAFESAARRWPESLAALIGEANARFAIGDMAGAETALRSAVRHQPYEGTAWNNLANVLAYQGRQVEAIAAARWAVTLGGPHAEAAKVTLEGLSASSHPMTN